MEGIRTTQIIYELAKEKGIDMPIIQAVYEVLFQNKKPRDAVTELMTRELKKE